MRVLSCITSTEEDNRRISETVPEYEYIFDENPTQEMMESADIILGCPNPKMLPSCTNLKWLQTVSAGVDAYIKSLPKDVMLTNVTGGYGLAIAEHMLGMYLSLIKKLGGYHDLQREHKWGDLGEVTSVWGSTVLVVGMGDIGTEFAKLCKAMGAYVIGVRRTDLRPSEYADEIHLNSELDELLGRADCVAVSLPGTKETANMFTKDRFAKMKKSAVFLNVGRGTIVDQDALVEALNNGEIFGAGLDVMTPEPLPSDNALWSAENVIITPHVSGGFHLNETKNRILNIVTQNLKRYHDGEELKNIIDFDTGYRKLK